MLKGNWGRILRINLSNKTHEVLELPDENYRDFLGGSGLAAKYFFDSRAFEHEPLSLDSPLIIMSGPLSSTNFPGSSRLSICGRSPLTGIWADSSVGGHFAPELKRTGYDGIVVVGASDNPVYLSLTDRGVEIRDAAGFWGKDTYDVQELLKNDYGHEKVQSLIIGPAGENLVRYACIINNRGSAAGRCGMGALMGSKKLKAIVVGGSKKLELADEEAYKEFRTASLRRLKHSLVAAGLKSFGSNVHMEYGMAIGDVPTKNWRVAYWPQGPQNLGGTAVAGSILSKTHSCKYCPISCKRLVRVEKGPFSMKEGPGSEYEAAAALGTLLTIDNREANNKANELCNRLGLDVISFGSTLAAAIEAFEKGELTKEDTGGVGLYWNDPSTLLDLAEKTARKEGFGVELAEGVRRLSEKYGFVDKAMHVKGLEIPMHDPRALWGMALTYATSIRGACHVADGNLYMELGISDPSELGVKRTWPFSKKGKALQTIAAQKKGSISNSAVICDYVLSCLDSGFSRMPGLLESVTGFDYTKEELLEVGDRIWYLKRSLGNLMGASKKDDTLPRRALEPHAEGDTSKLHLALYPQFVSMSPIQRYHLDRAADLLAGLLSKYIYKNMDTVLRGLNTVPLGLGKFPGISWLRGQLKKKASGNAEGAGVDLEGMLEDFYFERRLDAEGRPARAVLERLGLQDVAQELHSDSP